MFYRRQVAAAECSAQAPNNFRLMDVETRSIIPTNHDPDSPVLLLSAALSAFVVSILLIATTRRATMLSSSSRDFAIQGSSSQRTQRPNQRTRRSDFSGGLPDRLGPF